MSTSEPLEEALLYTSLMVRFLNDKMIHPMVRFLDDLTGKSGQISRNGQYELLVNQTSLAFHKIKMISLRPTSGVVRGPPADPSKEMLAPCVQIDGRVSKLTTIYT